MKGLGSLLFGTRVIGSGKKSQFCGIELDGMKMF